MEQDQCRQRELAAEISFGTFEKDSISFVGCHCQWSSVHISTQVADPGRIQCHCLVAFVERSEPEKGTYRRKNLALRIVYLFGEKILYSVNKLCGLMKPHQSKQNR